MTQMVIPGDKEVGNNAKLLEILMLILHSGEINLQQHLSLPGSRYQQISISKQPQRHVCLETQLLIELSKKL